MLLSIAWGALAKELYSPSSRYGVRPLIIPTRPLTPPRQIVPLSIFIGLAVPLPFWWLHKKFPGYHFDSVITPMICSEIGFLSGGINSSVFMTFLLCLFSQFYLRKYHAGWFRKYNFL